MSAKKRVSDGLESLLPRLDFGAVHQPTIWHVQTPQSRSDHCRKARVQRASENRNDSCDSNWNGHTHGNSPDARSCPQSRNASTGGEAAISPIERTKAREDPTCPSAAVTTAATTSHAFPVAESKICKEHTAECGAQEHQFCTPEQRFRIPECSL